MTLLSGRNVSLGYDGKKVVQGLSFEVNQGDYLCVVGENGSGKTTLMKTILGLVSPVEGKFVLGKGVNQNEIGYLPQQTDVQRDFPASVNEIVLSGCLNRSLLRPYYTKAEKQIAQENMEKLKISNLSKRCYRELSGGQQQRVLLARALCAARKILLLDEPVAGLDPNAAADMYEVINELNKKQGMTIIMISHDLSVAVKYASHILHIGAQPIYFGTKQKYLTTDAGKSFGEISGGTAK